MKTIFKNNPLKNRLPFYLFTGITAITFLISCIRDPIRSTYSSLLQYKWKINSRVAVFPGNTSLNFTETGAAGDYLDFRTNDSAYSYITAYLPFSIDTASYTFSYNTITVHDTRQYGIVFQHQDNNGQVQTTTDIEVVSLGNNSMVLKFPTQGTVNVSGTTTYYPGTITYTCSR